MKKLFLLPAMLLCSIAASAQNLQLHYDFGRHIYDKEEADRQVVTATFEQFKADKLGSWFYFIDLDFDNKGVAGAYTEISREFNFYSPCEHGAFAAHAEYNGGLSRGAGSFQQFGLFGAAWNGHDSDFSKTYSLQVMYKQAFGSKEAKHPYASFQVTGVWGLNFFDKAFTFSGFADLWQEKNEKGRYLVFLTEPQLWYNFNSKFSAGTEIEMSYNFPFENKKFFVNPTLAVKYNF